MCVVRGKRYSNSQNFIFHFGKSTTPEMGKSQQEATYTYYLETQKHVTRLFEMYFEELSLERRNWRLKMYVEILFPNENIL